MATKTVQDWISSVFEDDIIINDIAASLELGSLQFPGFIKDLSDHTAAGQDLTVVGRVLDLLPLVLDTIKEQPTRHDIHLVNQFVTSRIDLAEDDAVYRSGIGSLVHALRIVSAWSRFLVTDATAIVETLYRFGASNWFSKQLASTREIIYILIAELFKKHNRTLLRDAVTSDVVKGIVAMGELEKNPSCLRELYGIYEFMSKEWELSDADFQTIFESFIRYFPVSMKSTPAQPDVPTTEELKELLLKCFVAHDAYADATFEAMIARLDVESANTKLEALKTIERCVRNYSPLKIAASAETLWNSLKYEVWNGENEEFIIATLKIIQELGFSASIDVPQPNGQYSNSLIPFVSMVAKECIEHIRDGKPTYVVSNGRILKAVASSAPTSLSQITKHVVPVLDTLWQGAKDGIEKGKILGVFNNLLEARLVQPDAVRISVEHLKALDPAGIEPAIDRMVDTFDKYRPRIFEIYTIDLSSIRAYPSHADHIHFATHTIKGLAMMFSIPDYLIDDEKAKLMEDVNAIFIESSHEAKVHMEAVLALKKMASIEPVMWGALLARYDPTLPESSSASPEDMKKVLTRFREHLDDLVQISCTSTFATFSAMEEQLLHKLKWTVKNRPHNVEELKLIAAAMLNGLVEYDVLELDPPILWEEDVVGPYTPLVIELYEMAIQPKEVDDVEYVGVVNSLIANEQFIDIIGRFAMIALRSNSTTPKNNPLFNWNKNHPNGPSAIWSLFAPLAKPSLNKTQPQMANGPFDKCLTAHLSMCLLAGLRRKDKALLQVDIGRTAVAMIQNTVSTNINLSPAVRTSMLRTLQLLVNKYGAANEIGGNEGKAVVDIMKDLVSEASEKSQSEASRVYQTLAYFTAASLAALDPSVEPLVKAMLEGVRKPVHGRKVAQSFRVLLGPSDVIVKENFCIVRLLRKDRLYGLAVADLINLWRTATQQEIKENAIIALAGIIAFLDADMLKLNAKVLLPILLEGTNIQSDDWAKAAIIEAILRLIPLDVPAVEEHIGSIINRMTDRTHNSLTSPSDSSIVCRVMALEVLHALTKALPARMLWSKKAALEKELDVALDDCSREVRRKAEQCKMAWFNLTESE